MTDPPPQQENEHLEAAFGYISQGKKLHSEGDLWGAAESYLEARNLLQELALASPTESEEEARIAQLYRTQWHAYFQRTRVSLIAALEAEHEKDLEKEDHPTTNNDDDHNDTNSADWEYSCQDLSDEEASKRIRLFSAIFAKEITTPQPLEVAAATATATATATDTKSPEDGESKEENVLGESKEENGPGESKEDNDKTVMSLEERLMDLNANLPTGFKTHKERLQDINQGMKRLGMSVYNDGSTPSSNPLKIEKTRSASQQVEDIIAQAADEVAMGLVADDDGDGDNDGASRASNADDAISDDDYYSDDDGADSMLSDEVPELQNVAQIRDQVAATQAKLAELTALLDTLPSPEEQEEAEVSDAPKDDSPPFEDAYAKKMLTDAKEAVGKALKLWKVKPKQL